MTEEFSGSKNNLVNGFSRPKISSDQFTMKQSKSNDDFPEQAYGFLSDHF